MAQVAMENNENNISASRALSELKGNKPTCQIHTFIDTINLQEVLQ
jgi:hypothetical protein